MEVLQSVEYFPILQVVAQVLEQQGREKIAKDWRWRYEENGGKIDSEFNSAGARVYDDEFRDLLNSLRTTGFFLCSHPPHSSLQVLDCCSYPCSLMSTSSSQHVTMVSLVFTWRYQMIQSALFPVLFFSRSVY